MRDTGRKPSREIDADRIEVLEGHIGERDLGVASKDYERLTAEVTVAYHLAAAYNLGIDLDTAVRVNVEGTGNVLELCERCERFEQLHYASTAYVAGDRRGTVYEHELVLNQGFKNYYESTKFQAEVWVRGLADKVPSTIYRPAIVVGDSRTGETQKFDGPYYMLRAISLGENRRVPIAHFGSEDAYFNVVPVDFVISAMAALSNDPDVVGETLHLVDPEPRSSKEIFKLLSREYAGREPSMRLPPGLVANSLRFKSVQKMFAGAPRESVQY